ncbi:NDMA-dependent alcohol dehydrogenase [Pseudonocardia sp. MH-G8]|uniref:NDMA-dependent alcohol dehydrogenase n=1 Tax=Pseudonocardia sp. MH-G8 TaxID=1854588 RepID=UPI000BA0BA81|nr:NDMA-dependent alcohol dehydrogenase [Pseudonocardia sp. MH-G8]OZM77910.1 alcohol dehydrogenase [Pseudonocardia sp. MH-G8]
MSVHGAVLHEVGGEFQVEDLRLDEPKAGEVLVRVVASGMCHSDEHLRTGDTLQPLPLVMGHEGAGVVEAVGEGVTRVAPGDHMVTAFIPGCGRCPWCARGMQFVCDNGEGMAEGLLLDGTPRFHLGDGRGIGAMQRLGTFANHLVTNEEQCIRIDPDLPLDRACLVACGVATGWGSAVNAAKVEAGDVVVVLGTGGVGMNAVQGAAMAGAAHVVAVDPVALKREVAEQLGATASFPSLGEAMPHVHALTNGQGADKLIVTVGRVDGGLLGEAVRATSKMGTCVVTAVGQWGKGIDLSPWDVTIFARTIKGSLFGNCNPTRDIPRLLQYYRSGRLDLDTLVTNTYRVDQIEQGYRDMYDGRNVRGVVLHEH